MNHVAVGIVSAILDHVPGAPCMLGVISVFRVDKLWFIQIVLPLHVCTLPYCPSSSILHATSSIIPCTHPPFPLSLLSFKCSVLYSSLNLALSLPFSLPPCTLPLPPHLSLPDLPLLIYFHVSSPLTKPSTSQFTFTWVPLPQSLCQSLLMCLL